MGLMWYILATFGIIEHDYSSNLSFAIIFAITVLVISCPCAFSLAVPTVIMVCTSVGVHYGLLFKSGVTIENCSSIDTVVFDKTGTLTKAEISIEDFFINNDIIDLLFDNNNNSNNFSNNNNNNNNNNISNSIDDPNTFNFFQFVNFVESFSEHPISESIQDFYKTTFADQINNFFDNNKNENNIIQKMLENYKHNQKFNNDDDTEDNNNINDNDIECKAILGKGIQINFNNISCSIGKLNWIKQTIFDKNNPNNDCINIEKIEQITNNWSENAYSVVACEFDGLLLGAFGLADQMKEDAKQTVEKLKQMNIDVWMLSGDTYESANRIANLCGINSNNVIAEVIPEQKAKCISYFQKLDKITKNNINSNNIKKQLMKTLKLNNKSISNEDSKESLLSNNNDNIENINQQIVVKKNKRKVMMIGDGINDSIALVQADIGIAVQHSSPNNNNNNNNNNNKTNINSSDIAIEAADVILLNENIWKVVICIDLCIKAMRLIKWNFIWAILYNIIAIPLALGILYPLFNIIIPPSLAGLSEILSSVPVVLFSLLLNKYSPPNFS